MGAIRTGVLDWRKQADTLMELSLICSDYQSRHPLVLTDPTRFPKSQVSGNLELHSVSENRCALIYAAANLRKRWESGWQGCFEIDLFGGDGVVEFQELGVEEVASVAG
jgi:hypothetical protein